MSPWGRGTVLCSHQEQGGEPAGGASRRGDSEEEQALLFLFSSVRVWAHSAVASQLVPRWTWRHLVSVRTGAGTAEGCGRVSSVPVAGDEAVDARLQGVAGVVTPENKRAAVKTFMYTFTKS